MNKRRTSPRLASHVAAWLVCVGYLVAGLGVRFARAAALEHVANDVDRTLDRVRQPLVLGSRQTTLKTGGEIRYRLEVRDDFTFNDGAFEDDAVNLLRTRLNADLAWGPSLRVFVQGQDAESFAESGVHRTAAFVNQLDLHQLYAELGSLWGAAPVGLRIGRQELSYGDQRFVGAFGWSNVARVFDAATLLYKPIDGFQAHAWFSQLVLTERVRVDSADHGENFYGLYTMLKPVPRHTVDTFFFMRHDRDNELVGEQAGQRGQLKEYTLGNRLKGGWRDLDYGIEWAWQFGSRAHDDIRAWAWHQELGYTLTDQPWKPRLGMEYNHGSGDRNPKDGKVDNFDNLFPTNHVHYGYMDLASLRNLNHVELNISATPHKQLTLAARHHWFFLDTNKSGWFNANQGTIRPATPGASRTIGQEIDLTVLVNATKSFNVLLGYSHFHAGAFVRDSGASDDANFLYVQTALQF